jgi:pre-mRNA-splicing factor 18
MDALKAEIATKRKTLEGDGGRPNKYMRKGDIERMKEEKERQEREEREAKLRADEEAKATARAAKASTSKVSSRIQEMKTLDMKLT